MAVRRVIDLAPDGAPCLAGGCVGGRRYAAVLALPLLDGGLCWDREAERCCRRFPLCRGRRRAVMRQDRWFDQARDPNAIMATPARAAATPTQERHRLCVDTTLVATGRRCVCARCCRPLAQPVPGPERKVAAVCRRRADAGAGDAFPPTATRRSTGDSTW